MLIAKNTEFGPPKVIRLEEINVPVPQSEEILVRSKASTVTTADGRLRSKNVPRGFGFIMGLLFGFKQPKYKALGTCVAGEVVAIGPEVKLFKVGDRVLGNLGMKLGGHAQYVSLPENGPVIKIPETISDEDAAAIVFGGTTALVFLRDKLKVKKGDRLIVIGAGGTVGSAAIQIGKIFGAHVTAVCSTEKEPLVYELGADAVIEVNNDLLSGLECSHCQIIEPLLSSLGKVTESQGRCPDCGQHRTPQVYHTIDGTEEFLERTLAEIGVPLWDIVAGRRGLNQQFYEFAGDAPEVLGPLTPR